MLCGHGLGGPDLHLSLLQGLVSLPVPPPNPSPVIPVPPQVAAVQTALSAAAAPVPPGPLLQLCTAAPGGAVVVSIRCRERLSDAEAETVPGISPVAGGTQPVSVILRGYAEVPVHSVSRIAVKVLYTFLPSN